MDIPLDVKVDCKDGACGRSICVLINPVHEEITHFVVQTPGMIHVEYLVPVTWIAESTPQSIRLTCTRAELAECEPFTRAEYIGGDDDHFALPEVYDIYGEDALMWPYTMAESAGISVDVEQVPPGELAIHRGAHVDAADGRIGRVDEFLINPENNYISHLVLRQGHLWGQKDVTIPISAIQRIEDDVVHLKLTKAEVRALPSVPLRRHPR